LTNVNRYSRINSVKIAQIKDKMVRLEELERWLSTGQVSKKLDRSRQGVIDLAEARRLRAVKTAAGWLYDPESVEAFAEREKKRKED
jgi:Helix-turn-helix domain